MSNGARDFFAIGLPFCPTPQIWAPYSIVGLTTAVYSNRVRLNEGLQVDAVIHDAAANAAAPLVVAFLICSFQFSLESTQTPRTLRVAFGSASQPWILTVDARLLDTLLFLIKWISLYLFSLNLAPCCFAYAMHLLYA